MTPSVVRARSLDEALRALSEAHAPARVLAGGTDLMVELAAGRGMPELLVDVWRLDALRGIRVVDGELEIGALTTCAELARSTPVRERADVLALAASEVGAEQIKNRATLGGNLGTASPAADLAPALWVLDARVRLASVDGRRDVALDAFFVGYRRTACRPHELVECVRIPPRSASERRAFRKVGTRRAQSISKLVVAVGLSVLDSRLAGVRAAAGSIAERTLRLAAFERELEGRTPSIELFERAALASAREDARPIDDVRSTAEYRRHTLRRVLVTLGTSLAALSGEPA
jgi:carbon-monoxide dehydrogenase medium subunit